MGRPSPELRLCLTLRQEPAAGKPHGRVGHGEEISRRTAHPCRSRRARLRCVGRVCPWETPHVRCGRFPLVLKRVPEHATTLECSTGCESSKLPSQASIRMYQNDLSQENDNKEIRNGSGANRCYATGLRHDQSCASASSGDRFHPHEAVHGAAPTVGGRIRHQCHCWEPITIAEAAVRISPRRGCRGQWVRHTRVR
jgi:hypothetical protein